MIYSEVRYVRDWTSGTALRSAPGAWERWKARRSISRTPRAIGGLPAGSDQTVHEDGSTPPRSGEHPTAANLEQSWAYLAGTSTESALDFTDVELEPTRFG